MYTPKSFLETDRARLRSLIESHAFGTLLATDAGGALEIAHLPFLFDHDAGAHGELRFHRRPREPELEARARRPARRRRLQRPPRLRLAALVRGSGRRRPDVELRRGPRPRPREGADGRCGALSSSAHRLRARRTGAFSRSPRSPCPCRRRPPADRRLDARHRAPRGEAQAEPTAVPADRERVMSAPEERGGPDDLEMKSPRARR